MTLPSTIPGYAQGFRFKNDATFYDADSKVFHDLAGFGEANSCQITSGTPAFATPSGAGGREGLTLDNTVQGGFFPAIPWQGTMVLAFKVNMPSNGTIYPMIFGGLATATSNGRLQFMRITASSYSYRCVTAGSVHSAAIDVTDDGTMVVAYTLSQEDRQVHYTEDGVTVSSTSAQADNTNGNGASIGYAVTSGLNGHLVRLGNLSGTIGDTAATGNTMTLFEAHFFQSQILTDHLPETALFMAALRSKYGVS